MSLSGVARLHRHVDLLATVGTFVAVLGFSWARANIAPNDVDSALIPAWSVTHLGQLAMPPKFVSYGVASQATAVGNGIYSDRPPGMILLSIPGQIFFGQPSRWGVTIVAALLTAFSVWAAFKLWGSKSGLLVVIGTPLLYVAGRTLWPETACIAMLLAGLLVVRSGRHLWVLIPLVGLATLCRLPFGLLAAAILAVMIGRRKEAWWPAMGMFAGLCGLVAYSRLVFGLWSPAGPYPVAHEFQLSALWVGLISPARGVLWWSPWLLFVRLRRDRYALVLAITGAYVVGSWLTYDAWGGEGWPGYRYALPLAVLAAPCLKIPSTRPWVWLFDLSIAWSCAVAISAERLTVSLSGGRHPGSSGLPILVVIAFFVMLVLLIELGRAWAEPAAD
jgi:hypothetical protein